MTPSLNNAKRLVVKIGSLLLTDGKGQLHTPWMQALAHDLAELAKRGTQCILVSSGAVACGRAIMGLAHADLKLHEKQAAAACGQSQLVEAWRVACGVHGLKVAQMLLTADDTEQRKRYLNARTTLETLLAHNIIPIINENDSVTTQEIRYGDNDRLAARVAAMASADHLVLLSDIDGFYSANPKLDAHAKRLDMIAAITPEIEAMAGGTLDAFSSGGMTTKLAAAKMAVAAGCHMAIAQGAHLRPLTHMMITGECSWFVASQTPLNARKLWIAGAVNVAGKITLDEGAVAALRAGKSLLPAGVVAVQGEFSHGDTVLMQSATGLELGHGISQYSAQETAAILGKQSDAIEVILGYKRANELIHRDDMALKS